MNLVKWIVVVVYLASNYIRAIINPIGIAYECFSTLYDETNTEMNFLTDKGFLLGCNNEIKFKNLYPSMPGTQIDFDFLV